jgi:lysophospholipase L1-like esterase
MRRFAPLLPAFTLCASAFGQGTAPQQINLLPIADQRYGVAPFQVIALASSYLPVTITATGPVTLNGRWLTVTGVGTVTVSAHQAGNEVYAPADAEEQFTILPSEPVVQAKSATIVYGTPFDPSIFNASAMAVPVADPAADVPTVTSQFDTSQITGDASVSAPYNSPLLRYESSPMVESETASGREGMIPDPTMAVDHYYKVAFTCDCQRFEFAVQSRTANYRLWVDGSWTNADAEPLADDSPRTLFYQVAFPDKRPRQIKVMLDDDTPFFGVNAAASDTISAPQVPLGKRAIIYGDSLTTPIISEPTLPPAQPGRAGSGYPQDLGEYFNWDWWESGVSGSGFTVGGVDNLTFVQRALTDICGRNPDLVVLFGGLNDASSTEQNTQQGATNFLSEVNACLPRTPIYLLGPQAPSASVETAMAAAAALFPTTVDFAGTAPQYWVYGDRSDPTTGNAYLYLGDLSDNGGHPTPLGHDFLAEEVAASIMGLSPSLAPQAFNLFAPAPAIGSFGYSESAKAVLDAGDHHVSITFTPADAVNYAVVTQPVLFTVNRASSSLALTASATNILAGGKLTLTASVSPQIAGVPTGTVTFTADGLPLGNAPLDASGSAAFTTAGLALGTHSISASYAGDGNFLSSTPPLPVKIIVNPTVTPQITSLTPNYGAPAALIKIAGTNFGATQGNSVVTVGGAPSYVASWSNTAISILVPSRATTGNIIVTVGGASSNGESFTFYPYPAITGVSPLSGPVGTPVTVAGTALLDGGNKATVTFNGAPAAVLSDTSTRIMVDVPTGATSGPVDVRVNGIPLNDVGTFTVTSSQFSISSITPNYGAPAALIQIAGNGFGATQGSSVITVGGAPSYVASWSNTAISILVPSRATTGNIVDNVGGVSSNGEPFTFYPYPAITGLSTLSGPIGTPVTITGTALLDGGNNATVTFNGTPATVISDTSTGIMVDVPAGAISGPISVRVNGDTVRSSTNFQVVVPNPPQITAINPNYGAPAALITITGANFGATQGNSVVTVGGAPSYVASWSNTGISILVPSRAATGNIVVAVDGVSSNGEPFTFYNYPAIPGISPLSGPVGTPVTITGTALLDGGGNAAWFV